MNRAEVKRWNQWKDEVQRVRAENQHLQLELDACRPQLYRADQKIDRLEQRCQKLAARNKILEQKLADMTAQLKSKPPEGRKPPAFVKVNTPQRVAKKPGRKAGHAAALRPIPLTIDIHETVALPVDTLEQACCPECRTQLSDVKQHERLVEELVPSKVVTTCYHTTSGWCPSCRKTVESRAENQPPAADVPHAQLGLNALATAMMMRVCFRMPLRQITRFFLQLQQLKISPGAIVKQIKRTAKWMKSQEHRLTLLIRAAGVVYADETGWRTNGKNGYLWTISTDQHTLYHINRSRGKKVIAELLGKAFGSTQDQTLVSDFYSVYDQFDGPQQKCLAHLLRELREAVARQPELASHEFFRRCKRLIKEMLKLKKQRDALGKTVYAHRVDLLEKRLNQLAQLDWADPDAERLGKRLYKYRDKLTTFLHKPEVDGTNNAAERALRPAVVMRKITGGSRSNQAAAAWATLASVMRTAEQQGRDVLATIKTLLKAAWAGKDVALLTDVL
jgi:transposase